jgi:hypothetical protein
MPENSSVISPNRIQALRTQRQVVLDYCSTITHEEWSRPSGAGGWAVIDVLGHLTATCAGLFRPSLIQLIGTSDIERTNETLLTPWRQQSAAQLLDGFARWSAAFIGAARATTVGPVGSIPVRVGNLGTYPTRRLASMLVFDWSTHLTYDIASAVGRPVSPLDTNSLAATIEWMLAGVEQMNRGTMGWLDEPITLTLTGDVHGTWVITPRRDRSRLDVAFAGAAAPVSSDIVARSNEFPGWATRRKNWRDCDVAVRDHSPTATRFLDTLHII